METPISVHPDSRCTSLEDVQRRQGYVWYVAGGPAAPDAKHQIFLRPIRWPASVVGLPQERPDGQLALEVLTHSGMFPVVAPYSEVPYHHTWHLMNKE